MPETRETYYDITGAADYLGVSPRYMRRLRAEFRVPFHKFGKFVRFAESDLAAFAAAGRVEPKDAA